MENNEQKPTPFLKRVSELEKKISKLESRLETIVKALRRQSMNPQELNQRAEMIINMANQGMQPQAVMQQLLGRNANYQNQMQTVQTQLTNMAQGRPMNEFIIQALKQNGLTEQNAIGLSRLMGIK